MVNNIKLYQELLSHIKNNVQFLEDKPEENAETCLNALWLKAMGINKSVEAVKYEELNDLNDKQVVSLKQFIEKRISGIPVAHLTNRQNFMGLEFISDHRALIPRKETEILGKKALEVCKYISKIRSHPIIFDVCCGSGNLGIALASFFPNIVVHSSDLSEEAVALTRENISFLRLEKQVTVIRGNLFEGFQSGNTPLKADIIVCNPPYISSAKVVKMNSEISTNEPSLAFDGGMLGTKVIQQLIRESPDFLSKGGSVIFEVGLGQGAFIIQLCEKSKRYAKVEGISDNKGNIRVIHCKL